MSTIRAAGGVVWRLHDGEVEVAVVHRPRYDDWSLPKGKLNHGESELAAAVREVAEETGAQVVVSRRVKVIEYRVDGAPKTVAFWLMRFVHGDFVPNDEVDELRWLPRDELRPLLTHDIERSVLDEAFSLPLPDSVIVIVRHAKAGKRGEWVGDDSQRPLDATGRRQAERLVPFLTRFAPQRVLSAAPLRCVQTVAPFAESIGAEVEVEPTFGDDDFRSAPLAAETAVLSLARPGRVTLVSSQGTAIPGVLDALVPWVGDTSTRKGGVWVLSAVDGTITTADYYPDAAR